MKRIFAILLIASVAIIALFGALAMQHAGEHGHVGCLSAAAPVSACPANSAVAMFLFHAGILKSLLLAVVSGYVSFALLSLLVIIACVFIRNRTGHSPLSRYLAPLFLFDKFSHSAAPFMRWLALHENSPALG